MSKQVIVTKLTLPWIREAAPGRATVWAGQLRLPTRADLELQVQSQPKSRQPV